MQPPRSDALDYGAHATRTKTSAASTAVERIRFGVRLGQYNILIAAQTFSEVVTRAVLYPIPHTPPWFPGLLNQRGNLLPVFDVHQLLHSGEPAHDRRTVLVFDQGSDAVGLCIEGLPESVQIEQRLRHVPLLPAILAPHVSMAYVSKSFTWLDFDHQGFFTALGKQITTAAQAHF